MNEQLKDYNPPKESRANQESKIPGLKHIRNAVSIVLATVAAAAIAPKTIETFEGISNSLSSHTEQESKYSALERRISNIQASIRNGANGSADQAALDYFLLRKSQCEEASFQLSVVRSLDRANNSGPEVKDQLASANESVIEAFGKLGITLDKKLNIIRP